MALSTLSHSELSSQSATMTKASVWNIVWFILLLHNHANAVVQYECLPYPFPGECMIERVKHKPSDTLSFPKGCDIFTIDNENRRTRWKVFDQTIFEAMHLPIEVSITKSRMERLILPPDLERGIFENNDIKLLEVDFNRTYRTKHLNLDKNDLNDIFNISALVNVESLRLEQNGIKNLPGGIFVPLTKLKLLYLSMNYFVTVPWSSFSSSLTILEGSYGSVRTLQFREASLPSLRLIDLIGNDIGQVNVTEMLLVAPNLRQVYLNSNRISEKAMAGIREALSSKNITYGYYQDDNDPSGNTDHGDDDRSTPTWKAVLLTLATLVVGVLFVLIVWTVFKQMNK